MVVVPTFAGRDRGDKPIVTAFLARRKIAIAKQMRQRVDAPTDVPDQHGAGNHAPDQPTGGQLPTGGRCPVEQITGKKTGQHKQERV